MPKCTYCNNGSILRTYTCDRCDANGMVEIELLWSNGHQPMGTCPDCNGSKKITMTETCSMCNGTGETEPRYKSCPTCYGVKTIRKPRLSYQETDDNGYTPPPMVVDDDVTCPTCDGNGEIPE